MMLKDLDTARICRELALLLRAGIGLADGILLLAQQEQTPVQERLHKIAAELDRGSPLSDALQHSGIFPEYAWRMIRTGEETGRPENALEGLADFYETRHRTLLQVKSAVAYPAMVLLLMLVVLAVLLIKVLPVFDRVYASLGSRLTGVGAGLLYLGQGLQKMLPVLLILLVALSAGALLLRFHIPLREKAKLVWKNAFQDRGIARKFSNAHFAQAMAMGLSSGLTLEACIELARNLLQYSPGAARRCAICAEELKNGLTVREAVEKAQLMPPAQCRMLQLGLHSGNAEGVMDTIARNMQEEAQNALDSAITRIEPVMVLLCSLLVGLILLSVMLPLLDILSVLG